MSKISEPTLTYFDSCVADLKIPDEWENVSYGNDTCPSWVFKGFHIMIDHPDPKEREQGFEDDPRFHIFRMNDYGDHPSWEAHHETFSGVLKILADVQTYHDVANGFMEKHSKESYEDLPLNEWLLTYGNDLHKQDYKEGQAILELFNS